METIVKSARAEVLELLALDRTLTQEQEKHINRLTDGQYQKLVAQPFWSNLDYCLSVDACMTLPTGRLYWHLYPTAKAAVLSREPFGTDVLEDSDKASLLTYAMLRAFWRVQPDR